MELVDKDLRFIQETRNLIRKAKEAQQELATFSQTQIDAIVKAVSEATFAQREKLAKMRKQVLVFMRTRSSKMPLLQRSFMTS